MNAKISLPLKVRVTSVAYILGVLTLAIYGFITYSIVPVVNVLAVTVALYAGCSIVVGGGLKSLLTVLMISVLFTIVSDLCFAFLQPLIAIGISLFIMLAAVKYSLFEDHDSGWFGAICAELMGLVFLIPIEITLALTQIFPF